MATGWGKLRQQILIAKERNLNSDDAGRPRGSSVWGTVWEGAAPKRVENLKNVVPGRLPRSKSKIKIGPENSLQPSVHLDYSDTYRENDALEGDLEEHLDGLKRIEKRQLLEKGEELRRLRKQMEVITRLQEAVNSRKPGQSARLVASRSSRASLYGQFGQNSARGRALTRKASRPAMGSEDVGEKKKQPEVDLDFTAVAQATRSQMRIAAERDKFSAKNLFNVRRPKSALGNYTGGDKMSAPQKRFFAGPALSSNSDAPPLRSDSPDSGRDDIDGVDDLDDSYSLSRQIISVEIHNVRKDGPVNQNRSTSPVINGYVENGYDGSGSSFSNRDNSTAFFHRPGSSHYQHQHNNSNSPNQKPVLKKTPSKGYLRPTTASRGGGPLNLNTDSNGVTSNTNAKTNRPKTAVGFVTPHDDASDRVLPPRPKSAVMRSRSRRELELLCRMWQPAEEEADTANLASALVSGDAAHEWEVINEKRRRRRLKELRQEGQKLEVRVKSFLEDIDGFNKRSNSPKRKPSSTDLALQRMSELDALT